MWWQLFPPLEIYNLSAADLPELDSEEIEDADEVEPMVAGRARDEMSEDDAAELDESEPAGESLKCVLLGWPDAHAESSESCNVATAEDPEAPEDAPSVSRRWMR